MAEPEEVGLSSERLTRINDMMQRHIAAGEISGGVTVVARRGRIAHFEAHGTTGLETGTPMAKDSVFRIASMTKVVAGVAIMLMVEEGQVQLTDPVSRFIPEFKNLTVAVERPRQGGRGGDEENGPQFYTVPADRDVTVRDLLTHTSTSVSRWLRSRSRPPGSDMMQRHIAAGEISGGVIVARRGRIAHFEAHGTTGLETGTPMAKDSVFRIASMTKVVASC